MTVAVPGAGVANWVANAVEAIERWFAELGPFDFVLLVLALWAFFWMWSAVRAATRLGPVEVATLDVHPKDDDVRVHALTTLLRERLAKSGLMPPPEVPAGSPQTNLIAAVEASGHPQAAWIGKALSLLPQPPRSPAYRLSGTLLGDGGNGGGLRYWLQPKEAGRPLLDTVEDRPSHEDAVRDAAADIFLAISHDAVHVFPPWSRWHERDALLEHLRGLAEKDDTQAEAHFTAAAAASRSNLLPHLHLANLMEKSAATGVPAATDQAELERIAVRRARALRKYLDIGVAQPDIVSARYRASVVAAMLASDWERLTDSRQEVIDIVGLAGDEQDALYALASTEARNAHQLVGRFHVLLYHRRLRHRFEPSGLERRRLRRTMAIASHAFGVRRIGLDNGLWARVRIRWHRAVVRCWHLGIWRAAAGWNAHYGAACFYALLYEREVKIDKPASDAT